MFKKFILVLLITLFLITSASAVTLAWDPNTDSVKGYQVYYREKGETEVYNTAVIIHPTVTVIILDKYFVPEVIYEFWAIAYYKGGSSLPSDIIEYTRKGYQPPGEKLSPEYVITLPVIPENFNGTE